jgi:hypothetical protein
VTPLKLTEQLGLEHFRGLKSLLSDWSSLLGMKGKILKWLTVAEVCLDY